VEGSLVSWKFVSVTRLDLRQWYLVSGFEVLASGISDADNLDLRISRIPSTGPNFLTCREISALIILM